MKFKTKRNILIIFSIIILSVNLALKNQNIAYVKGDDPINVVASISIVGDFATQIGNGIFTVTSIVTGTENPHIYEPLPSEIQAVVNADIFIRLGLEDLEPWVDAVLTANPSIPVLTLFNSSMMRYDPLIDTNNPHIWMDPNNAKIWVEQIYTNITQLDPSNIAAYQVNRDTYLSELDSLLSDISAAEETFNGTKVVVHHPAFMYLFDLLGVVRVAAIEEHEGEEPSAQHIAEVIEAIETENVSMIINQPQLEEEEVAEIARDTGIQITELTPLLGVLDEKGYVLAEGELIETYIDMIRYNLAALANPYDPPAIGLQWYWWTLIGIGGAGILGTIITVFVVRSRNS